MLDKNYEQLTVKTCKKCGETKLLDAFCKSKNGAQGRNSICRKCAYHRLKEWRANNPEPRHQQSKRRHRTDRHKWYNREYQNRWRAALRAEVLEAYGRCCACCGESMPEFLTVDHIHNDGKEHRKEISTGSQTLYSWLKKHGFPQDRF
jgi:hypothetical protein